MLLEGEAACEGEALQSEDDDLESRVTKFLNEGRKEVGETKAEENRRRVSKKRRSSRAKKKNGGWTLKAIPQSTPSPEATVAATRQPQRHW